MPPFRTCGVHSVDSSWNVSLCNCHAAVEAVGSWGARGRGGTLRPGHLFILAAVPCTNMLGRANAGPMETPQQKHNDGKRGAKGSAGLPIDLHGHCHFTAQPVCPACHSCASCNHLTTLTCSISPPSPITTVCNQHSGRPFFATFSPSILTVGALQCLWRV